MLAEGEGDGKDVQQSNGAVGEPDPDRHPHRAEQAALGEEEAEDSRRRRAHGGDGADLADALIDGHDHHVHHGHQHDRDQEHADAQRHHVDHVGDGGEGRETVPRMHLEGRSLAFGGAGGEGGLEGGGGARDGVEVAGPQHELAHLRFRAAQDGAHCRRGCNRRARQGQ